MRPLIRVSIQVSQVGIYDYEQGYRFGPASAEPLGASRLEPSPERTRVEEVAEWT